MSQWIYSVNGQTKEPVSDAKIVDLVLRQELEINDYVMNPADGMWKRIKDVPVLMDKIHAPETAIPQDPKLVDAFQEFVDGNESHNVYFYIPISRLIKMTILTMGIYQIYWWYKQWYYWATKKKQKHQSFDRAFGWFLAPLMLLDKIQLDPELNKVERSDFNGRTLFLGLIAYSLLLYVISIAIGGDNMFYLPIYFLGFIGDIMFLLPVQNYINRVNEKLHNKYEQPGMGHYASLVVGIFFWILELVSGITYLIKSM